MRRTTPLRTACSKLEKELAGLEEQSASLTTRWRSEKDKLGAAQKIKEQLEKARIELEQAQRRGEYQRAGELTYGVIPDLEKKLAEVESESRNGVMEEAVTPDHIAQIVSRWTGVPVDRMLQGERTSCSAWRIPSASASSARSKRCTPCLDRGAARPSRPAGPQPADRFVHVPRTHRRWQDRADESARELPVRRRIRARAHRHVGIHGEALGRPPHRRASRLCRL